MEKNRTATKIDELYSEIERLRKVNAALMGRVERGTARDGGAFAIFEGNILLSNQVNARTE